jgi:hypothetical protein
LREDDDRHGEQEDGEEAGYPPAGDPQPGAVVVGALGSPAAHTWAHAHSSGCGVWAGSAPPAGVVSR